APMGRASIGGVITSTLLTLVVVPVLYAYLDRWLEARAARRARRAARRTSGRETPPAPTEAGAAD
ncbi:MAG: hypothetical protein IT520_14465, partial [Burkholderiales bacterium]|nr:hypothetical protein [Burkholderiales bacterium]